MSTTNERLLNFTPMKKGVIRRSPMMRFAAEFLDELDTILDHRHGHTTCGFDLKYPFKHYPVDALIIWNMPHDRYIVIHMENDGYIQPLRYNGKVAVQYLTKEKVATVDRTVQAGDDQPTYLYGLKTDRLKMLTDVRDFLTYGTYTEVPEITKLNPVKALPPISVPSCDCGSVVGILNIGVLCSVCNKPVTDPAVELVPVVATSQVTKKTPVKKAPVKHGKAPTKVTRAVATRTTKKKV